MRYALITIWMIGFACLVTGLTEPPASAQIPPPAGAVVVTSNPTGTHFTVAGPYQTTREDAWQGALDRAQKEVASQLQSDGILAYQPSAEFVRSRLVKSWKEEEKVLEDPVGKVRRIVLDISISPQHRMEIQRKEVEQQVENHRLEQRARVSERMTAAGVILAGLVAVLAAIAGYLRLDELTKGYYTGWLLAAAGVIGAVALAGITLYLVYQGVVDIP